MRELESQLSFFPKDSGNDIVAVGKLSDVANYPNPFNPSTTIAFSLSSDSKVSIDIYNIKGQKVKKLADTQFEAGAHKVVWNGIDKSGKSVSSGVYFYKVDSKKDCKISKMILLK